MKREKTRVRGAQMVEEERVKSRLGKEKEEEANIFAKSSR